MGRPVPEPPPEERPDPIGRLATALVGALTDDEVLALVERDLPPLLGVERVRVLPADPPPGGPPPAGGVELESARGGVVGVLVCEPAWAPGPDEQDQVVVRAALRLCADALWRAGHHGAEVAGRRRAEHERSQLAFLAEVSNAVASSLATRQLLERLCTVSVPRLGDWSTIFLTDGVVLERVAGAHADPAKQHLVDRLVGSHPVPLGGSSPIARSFRTRETQVIPAIDRSVVTSIVDDPDYVDTVLALSSGGGMMVPLVVRDRAVGVIAFGLESAGRQFGTDEVWLATELARRAAIGVDNASKYEQEHLVAELLQRAVLPEELPVVAGMDLAARYLPAGPGVEVGGDWYDSFVLDDGSLALVIGDVAGHDVEAASVMAQLRNALRAYAFEGSGPAEVLGQLNRLLCRSVDPLFATVVVAVVSPDRRRVRWASAGHPPSILVTAGGPRLLDRPRGLLLGMHPDERYPEGEADLAAGDLLVLYTDGLVERRDDDLDTGIDRLGRVAARVARRGPGADAVSERLLGSMLAGHLRTDDVCVLVAWSAPGATALEFAVPADASSGRAARVRVRAQLEAWDAAALAEPVELLVSELVTNAVMHVGSEVRLRLERLPAGVRVRVFDAGDDTVAARPRHVAPDSPAGRGLLIVDNVADRWGVERTSPGKQVWFELSFEGAARRWRAGRVASAQV